MLSLSPAFNLRFVKCESVYVWFIVLKNGNATRVSHQELYNVWTKETSQVKLLKYKLIKKYLVDSSKLFIVDKKYSNLITNTTTKEGKIIRTLVLGFVSIPTATNYLWQGLFTESESL